MEKISLLIADDHALVRETWSFILGRDPRFAVAGETGSAEEAIELARKLRPAVILLDINLPGMSGIEAVPLLRKYSPATRILAVSVHTQPTYVRQIMQKGAMGYMTKNSHLSEMFRALLEIINGRKYICEEIRNIIAEQEMHAAGKKTGCYSLTPRELEIIALIRQGDSSKEIAKALSIAVKTVDVHRYNILRKLKFKNSSALINFINNREIL